MEVIGIQEAFARILLNIYFGMLLPKPIIILQETFLARLLDNGLTGNFDGKCWKGIFIS